jgi:homoserine O-acetyltransferase
MKVPVQLFSKFSLCMVSLFVFLAQAECQTEIVNIGNFYTEKHQLISNCKIGYTSIGKKNANASNVIVVPTWYTGSSNDVLVEMASLMLDTSKYYIMVVDALGNGISSSPSNTPDFPAITISDMVKATHQLLDDVLHIHQIYAVVGVSMGGMQAFQWGVDYPLYVGKLVSIVGTPKQSTYDLLQWKTFSSLLSLADKKLSKEEALELYHHTFQLTIRTPDYWNQRFPASMADSLLNGAVAAANKRMQPKDYLAQMSAMINHDVERYTKAFEIRDMLAVVAVADHMVTPDASLDFARKHQLTTYVLQGLDGHMLGVTQFKKLADVLRQFLK